MENLEIKYITVKVKTQWKLLSAMTFWVWCLEKRNFFLIPDSERQICWMMFVRYIFKSMTEQVGSKEDHSKS